MTRLFRNLWLYTAMYKLANPAAGVSTAWGAAGAGAAGEGAAADRAAAEWQVAAGRLAAVSPLLVVGTDSYYEADMVERLKVGYEQQYRLGCSH